MKGMQVVQDQIQQFRMLDTQKEEMLKSLQNSVEAFNRNTRSLLKKNKKGRYFDSLQTLPELLPAESKMRIVKVKRYCGQSRAQNQLKQFTEINVPSFHKSTDRIENPVTPSTMRNTMT